MFFYRISRRTWKKVTDGHLDGKIDVQLHLGKRYCTQEQKDQLTGIVEQQQKLCVKKSKAMSLH